MADGKWIADLSGDMPVAEAARQVLKVRLEVVRERLPLAVNEADRDPEHVHQLRVGTRRAAAALRIFRDCLPAKVHRRARKLLRKLRRAAGAARDWDVFALDLLARQEKRRERRPGVDFLVGYALGQRAAAQTELVTANAETEPKLDKDFNDIVHQARRPENGDDVRYFRDLARPILTELLHELETAAAKDLDEYEHLHQVRILGKRLRYAMEIFESCFAAPFKEVYYPAVEEMQEILGAANDSYVASGRLAALRDHLQATQPKAARRLVPGIEGLIRSHQRRLPRQRKRFRKWWDDWQRSGAEAAFAELLHVPVPADLAVVQSGG